MPSFSRSAPAILFLFSVWINGGAQVQDRPNPPDQKAERPAGHGVSWFSEWTYCGYGESFYASEGFRTHLVATGVRITR